MNSLLGRGFTLKKQAVFSSKDKSKIKITCRPLQFLFGALRVNCFLIGVYKYNLNTFICEKIICLHSRIFYLSLLTAEKLINNSKLPRTVEFAVENVTIFNNKKNK